MYKSERKKLISLLDTFKEMIDYLKERIEQKSSYLENCQIALAAIDRFLTSNCDTYKQDYFEIINQLILELSDIDDTDLWKKTIKRTRKAANSFANYIEKLPVRIKAVFLPYKASMWTALESIWKAAQDDPACDAFVIPIPYWNLKLLANGECKKLDLVYEGSQFPHYVPITRYDTFSIPDEQPDMIFIHNPYDETNNLTRVPEEYYSSTLKKHTDMLVYSPYFTLGANSERNIPPQCFSPAVTNSHKIVAQSKLVAEYYVQAGCPRSKVLTVGSPKVDAVVSPIEPPVIPDEWKRKTAGRKVILLNTHFSYILVYEAPVYGGQGMELTKVVIETILNSNDAALIWRPHPLLVQMLESRERFDLAEEIRRLQNFVSEAPNGILDQNGSYEASFALADAYITTRSSLDYEFMLTKKPMLDMELPSWSQIPQERLNAISTDPVMDIRNVFYAMDDFSKLRHEYEQLPDYHEAYQRVMSNQFSEKDVNLLVKYSKVCVEDSIKGYIEAVKNNKDWLQEKRYLEAKRAFQLLDGCCGGKIYDIVKQQS